MVLRSRREGGTMRVQLTVRASIEMRRYVYSEMIRLGLSQENLTAAYLDQSDIFQTILEFDVPEPEQETLKIARRRHEHETSTS
jgi:hypothetical protein